MRLRCASLGLLVIAMAAAGERDPAPGGGQAVAKKAWSEPLPDGPPTDAEAKGRWDSAWKRLEGRWRLTASEGHDGTVRLIENGRVLEVGRGKVVSRSGDQAREYDWRIDPSTDIGRLDVTTDTKPLRPRWVKFAYECDDTTLKLCSWQSDLRPDRIGGLKAAGITAFIHTYTRVKVEAPMGK